MPQIEVVIIQNDFPLRKSLNEEGLSFGDTVRLAESIRGTSYGGIRRWPALISSKKTISFLENDRNRVRKLFAETAVRHSQSFPYMLHRLGVAEDQTVAICSLKDQVFRAYYSGISVILPTSIASVRFDLNKAGITI